jgi:hypothetical protein
VLSEGRAVLHLTHEDSQPWQSAQWGTAGGGAANKGLPLWHAQLLQLRHRLEHHRPLDGVHRCTDCRGGSGTGGGGEGEVSNRTNAANIPTNVGRAMSGAAARDGCTCWETTLRPCAEQMSSSIRPGEFGSRRPRAECRWRRCCGADG